MHFHHQYYWLNQYKVEILHYSQVIDPFPRPNKHGNDPQNSNSEQVTQHLNNCDIEYVQKPILQKPLETIDSTQSMQSVTNETMKENIIRELLETEENYVKLLSSLCIGYVVYIEFEISILFCFRPTHSLRFVEY